MSYERGGEHDGTKGFALGILVGALFGAGAALLMAPASGDETRRVLRRKARRLSKRGSQALGQVTHVAEDAERAARQLARRGRKAAMRARDMAESFVDEGGRRYSRWRS